MGLGRGGGGVGGWLLVTRWGESHRSIDEKSFGVCPGRCRRLRF